MKSLSFLLSSGLVLSLPAVAAAQQAPTDIPADHWAQAAVRELAAKGLVLGYPDGSFLGTRPLSRYEMAALIKRLLDYLAANPVKVVTAPTPAPQPPRPPRPPRNPQPPTRPASVTPQELAKVSKLVAEFKAELAVLGADLKAVQKTLAEHDQELIDLRQDVKDLQTLSKEQRAELDGLKKVHFSGYLQLRYDALFGDSALFKNAGAGGTGQRPTQGGPHVGGPSNGFLVRRGRFRVDGPLNPQDHYVFQLDFGTVSGINLRDAWADVQSGLPRHTTFRIGQFPPPFTFILPNSSRVRESPERPLGFSDSGNAALVVKDNVSSLGGEVTPGSIVPLFTNQDRDQGAQLTYKGSRATTQFGWFNGEGRDVNGQRPLNSALTFMGRVEQRVPTTSGDLFVGLSRYDGKYSVRGAAPTGGTPAAFRYANREFTNIDSRWVGRNGFELRGEYLQGHFETTPDRALFLPGNRVHAWYTTVRQPLNRRTVLSATYDLFAPTSQTVAGVTAHDYERRTLQGGVLHQLAPGTRLRLWYVQALRSYDPSAAAGSPLRKKVGQFIGEIQVEY